MIHPYFRAVTRPCSRDRSFLNAVSLPFAGVAQLVEHQLPKLNVAGSSPVSRSSNLLAMDQGRFQPHRMQFPEIVTCILPRLNTLSTKRTNLCAE